MASPAVRSIAYSRPVLSPADIWWRHVLLDSLALIEAEIYDQERSSHPGSKHRLAELRLQRGDRRLQLALLEAS